MNTKYPLLWSALFLALGVVLYDTFPSFFFPFPREKGTSSDGDFPVYPHNRYGSYVSG